MNTENSTRQPHAVMDIQDFISNMELEFFNSTELDEVKDDGLMNATLKSLETGKITPLLKEELRCRIQTRRLSEGKSELVVTLDPTPPVRDKLCTQDMEKLEKRREQNRRAARKLRQKKVRMEKSVVAEFERLGNQNSQLKEEIFRLANEKQALQNELLNHICSLAGDLLLRSDHNNDIWQQIA